MKQILTVLFFLILSINLCCQDSNFNFEFNYPIPIDDNFIGRNYNGIIDVGLRYRFLDFDNLNLGAAFNAGMFKSSKDGGVGAFSFTTYIFSPKLFTEFKIKSLTKLHPSLGLGYTFLRTNVDEDTNNNSNNIGVRYNKFRGGINLNVGVAYDITKELLVQVQYDFYKVGDAFDDSIKFNTNINILKIGLGYRL